MTYETVELEHHCDNKVALLRLNRPDRLNAFNTQLILDMKAATTKVKENAEVRVVVITGNGRGFCAGADLASRGEGSPWVDTEEALMQGYWSFFRNIAEMPKPVISAVNGPAAGAGAGLAMAGDLMVMAESAYIMLAFSNIALVPDCGASWFLTRALGYRGAFKAAIEAEKISAQACLDAGLTNKVVADGEVVDAALAWAGELAQRPPRALAQTKELMLAAANSSLAETFKAEAVRQNALIGSPDNREGVTAFIEKRAPKFTGAAS